ncbi:AbrB/MazE/SpoVT family DNA-binding domain-containing protein [Salinicoccus luteus]|uniref:AbrB/MazE/SpoVT family DNA-binding domain-containing protein n=1 Tax=Salinicoccus luteus TaxID=367840 RepID=UPI0004E13322|nr:AbrB/MazE/SpoVT family DNA-binding domain-containing protein [Salinicoccus luteus]
MSNGKVNQNPLKKSTHRGKRVTVSSKRQISIPKEFCDALGIENDVILELHNNGIIVRPVKQQIDDFSEELLSDLIDEGYEGQDLKRVFAERKAMISSAVDSLAEEAHNQKAYNSLENMLEDAH